MRFDIVTIFPGMFEGPFDTSILKRAVTNGKIEIRIHDLRQWTEDKHKVTDDYPYGGGPGMVMKVEPFARACDDLRGRNQGAKVALMTPQGEPLTQSKAMELSTLPGLILLCGRYEGVDERVRTSVADMEISIGDYVLTGGEIPAMVLLDSVARLVPSVVGDMNSLTSESHYDSMLEYPQYTRPPVFRGLAVPDVLLGGNHREIEQWRDEQAMLRTMQRRPDLLRNAKRDDKKEK